MKKRITYSIVIIFVFLITLYGEKIFLNFVQLKNNGILVKLILTYGWWMIPVVLVTGLLFGFNHFIRVLGLNTGILTALAFSLLCVSPMLISSVILGKLNGDISDIDLINKTAFAGFFEELLFRGFLFGLLFRKLKWGFLPASILGAVLFGLGHLYQGSNLSESIGVFTVTFLGALWFSWLYIEWNNNLWVPIFLHGLMNLSWILFDVSGNAADKLAENIFRIITIALSIYLTIRFIRRKEKRRITGNKLFVNK